jgi:Fe-S cluster biogenesis protein NfuA
MPNVTSIESTPNPLATKYVLDAPLQIASARQFDSAARAAGDALAASLFALDGVAQVFYTNDFVTVTRTPGADADALESAVAECIEAYKPKRIITVTREGAPAAAALGTPEVAAYGDDVFETETDDPELLMRINQILDEHIRPYLLKDGGGLDLLSLQDFSLTVRYKGACGGCPSAVTGTLFAINNLLQNYVDDRIQVVLDY